ncbi:MAG: hypothetical protein MO852_04430 [Candidatus Devosia euplotis]|nr:hypothetical protein [Candidatus Devosia euplotis]
MKALLAAQLPLSQASTNTPFSVTNAPALLEVMEGLLETNEAFKQEWEGHNLKVLGLTATDLYDIYTKVPPQGIADINGMKLSAPGVLGSWLRGTGANVVDGALTTFYTDAQTGVSDGALSLALGVPPIKLYEVAPISTGSMRQRPSRVPSPSIRTTGKPCPKKCRTPWSRRAATIPRTMTKRW